MKKLAVLCLVLSLVMGCAGFKDFLGVASDMLCNPTAEQQAQADAAIQFISIGTDFAGQIVGLPITGAQATAILYAVKTGTCVLLTQLHDALAFFDAVSAQVKAKVVVTRAIRPVAPDVSALRAAMK